MSDQEKALIATFQDSFGKFMDVFDATTRSKDAALEARDAVMAVLKATADRLEYIGVAAAAAVVKGDEYDILLAVQGVSDVLKEVLEGRT